MSTQNTVTTHGEIAPKSRAGRQRGDGRRAEIVRLAAQLFDEGGYHKASMEDLADAVGLAKPTLYHYFPGKDEILFRIHQEFIQLLIERQQARSVSSMDPAEQLRAIMRDILELMETHRGHVRVFFEHHRELPQQHQATVNEQRTRYQRMVEHVVRAGIAQGYFRDVEVRLTALAIFGMCNWAYQWYRAGGPLSTEEIADYFFDLFREGVSNSHRPGVVRESRTNH